jgi:hypothetical protein
MRAIEAAGVGEEPVMPGLSAHFPEMEYHGAAQYTVKCDCGFQTRKPENYYLTKARWADHAALSNPNERLREADRAGANSALSAINELVSVLLDDGKDAMLARADKLRLRYKDRLVSALSPLPQQPGEN